LASDEEIIESELKGKTLLVYMHILKSKESSVGVRAVQRALGFSSPSVSSYHLNKLKDLGLVESIRGDYSLIREVRVGVLKQFVSVGGVLLPRYLFYAVLVTTMLATFLFQNPFILTEMYITTVIFGIVPLVILWYGC
jgi:DNA-binding transcriptional ArsR family regulator